MHPDAYDYVARTVSTLGPFGSVLEIGGRNVNGSIRSLFGPDFIALDIAAGPGVDIVADAATWEPRETFDVVVCCEVLEHTPNARAIVATMGKAAGPGAALIVTAACPPRPPHSAHDGGPLQPDEFYANVDPDDLRVWLSAIGPCEVEVDHRAGDVYAYCKAR